MNPLIERLVKTRGLPSPPGVAFRLLELYDQEDVEIEEISRIISADPVLASRLISYCNSPLLARRMGVSSINQAVVAIGLRAVKMISLSFSLVTIPDGDPDEISFDFYRFWNRSLATAIAARTLATHARGDAESCSLMGLMLNIGQMALGHAFQKEYNDAALDALASGQSLVEMESARWDVDRYELGGQLLSHWKFPPLMIEIIRNHGADPGTRPDGHAEIARTLRMADQMAELVFQDEIRQASIDLLRQNAVTQLKIANEDFDGLFDQFVAAWSDYGTVLSFDCSHAKTFDELESEARRGIAELSMGLHAENVRIAEENQELRTNVYLDTLTGLKNRRAYNKEAAAELERCIRTGRTFVMMVIDIDHFKSINDRLGHDVGDEVLVQVAETLNDQSRQYDSVFRIGGEEFVIVLADVDLRTMKCAAQRFRTAIESMICEAEGVRLPVTVSIGVACCPDASLTLAAIFKEADQALYDAKAGGRNRCCFRICAPPTAKPNLAISANSNCTAK